VKKIGNLFSKPAYACKTHKHTPANIPRSVWSHMTNYEDEEREHAQRDDKEGTEHEDELRRANLRKNRVSNRLTEK
jgi:hypothetical protein